MSRVKLGDVAQEYKATVKDCSNLPIVGLEHLTPGEIALERWDEGTENTFTKGFKKGQMLFGRRRAYLKKAAVAPFDGVCSGDITVIEAIPGKILPELLPFIIQNDLLFDYAVGKSAGSLSPRVKWVDLKDYEFELPEIEKQTSLVDLLKAAHATRKAYQEQIKATDDLVKSQFIEMFGEVKTNPHGFEKVSLTSVCDFQGGSQPPKKDWVLEPKTGYIRMLQIRDFTQSEKNFVEYVRISNTIKTCQEDDILIGRYGASVGKILTGLAGAYNVAIIKSIPDKTVLDRIYLMQYFLSDYFQEYVIATGAGRGAQAGFNKDDLSRIDVLLPPMSLQQCFAEIVEQTDKSKFELQQAIEKVDNLIKSLIQQDNN